MGTAPLAQMGLLSLITAAVLAKMDII